MGSQSLKILIGLIIFAFLLGGGVLVYAWFSSDFSYSFSSNIQSNRDYYPDLTKELEKQEPDLSQSE